MIMFPGLHEHDRHPDNREYIRMAGDIFRPEPDAESGTAFPQWQGNFFTGVLAGEALWRVKPGGNTVVEREQGFPGSGERIRDVEQGAEGFLYLSAGSGKLIQARN
jgi:hypothetical protein